MDKGIPNLNPIAKLMFEKTGINLPKENFYIVLTKIHPLIEKYNFLNIEKLIEAIEKRSNLFLISDIVDALTVHETSFFRDFYPYDVLKSQVIPELLKNYSAGHEIKILCAACSTGQEPYSLAMSLNELNLSNFNFNIKAIDIAKSAIEKAKMGIYNQFEVQRGLSSNLLLKYFDQVDKFWTINSDIKKNVSFMTANLMNDLSFLGKFDLIFCRNVLMYFAEGEKKLIVANLKKLLNPKSFIFIGATEILPRDENGFSNWSARSGIYRLN